ncbi:unnamed protein product, partial [Mesorhabditis belari]|uniref:Calponin-homology (CH) domain-containing protein n=1 Tax=Mesorhabditis belari TaxID=2138241 RepID=A0AAF3FK86_9BILA
MARQSYSDRHSMQLDEPKSRWVHIQMHTFTNWINEQLRGTGYKLHDLAAELSDGVLLIKLVESLQDRLCSGKVFNKDPTEIQMLMNVQMALDAMRRDGIKLVNIGSHDIVEGNPKLVLGLIWTLIQRYQIASKTKIPPKKLMMAWVQSVLPELKITNFRTNWNNGVALSALLEYCQPGLCPEWKRIDPEDGRENCARGIRLAERYLGIPPILSAEHLSSPDLDELSCITYLSYFVKKGSPGYRSTMYRVQQLIGSDPLVEDFSPTWCDGYILCRLIESVGGRVPEIDSMQYDDYHSWVYNVRCGLDAAADLGVGSLVGAEDIADSQGEHLGIMALAAALCAVGPTPSFPITQCYTNQQVNLDLAFADGGEVRTDELDIQVIGPNGNVLSNSELQVRKSRTVQGAVLSLIPIQSGYHQIRILCQGNELPSSPVSLQVLSADSSRDHLSVQTPIRRALSTSKRVSPDEEVAIEHQSFAKRRAQIVKKLEEQRAQTVRLEKHREERNERNERVKREEKQERREERREEGREERREEREERDEEIQQEEEYTQYQETEEISYRETITRHERPYSVPSYSEENREKKMSRPRTLSDVGLISFSGLSEPCAVGSIVEVVINAHGDASKGEVLVESESPSGRLLQCPVSRVGASFTATFNPDEVGTWQIGIIYDEQHIRGSPFNCQVYDANLVNVYGLDVGLVGQELRFSIDSTRAGEGDIEVSVLRHGRPVAATLEQQSRAQLYTATFIPDGAGQYKIHVLFNKMDVKGSPFLLDIADASSVSVYGENLRMASVGRPATFSVHAIGAQPKDITVTITGPTGATKFGRVLPVDDGSYRIEWKPSEAGEHSVDVRLYGQSVYDGPFVCNVGDPERVSIRSMPRRIRDTDMHTDLSFEIDASAAGSGNLEIMINGGRVPCRVRDLGSRQYLALFTPTESITHTVEMRFNGESVRGSPWRIDADGDRGTIGRKTHPERAMSYYSELSGAGLVRAPVDKFTNFDITGEGLELNDIEAKITSPDGREHPIRITSKGTAGRFRAEYRVEKVGEHQLNVWIAGKKVEGCPLAVAGYSASKVRLEPLGGGEPGKPVQFVVDAVEAGKGQLEISVNQGRVPNNVQMQGAGRCLVTFIPQHPGQYVIDVTFNGEPVHGCPIKVDILPKQVGTAVAAPLSGYSPTSSPTRTTFNTGIAGGYASRGSGPTSPTSPTLLRETRTRSADPVSQSGSDIRSATLLKDVGSPRSRFDRHEGPSKPWERSYAPTGARTSHSFSPQRDLNATSPSTTMEREKASFDSPRQGWAEGITSQSPITQRVDSRTGSSGPTSPYGILKRSGSPQTGAAYLEQSSSSTVNAPRGSNQYMEQQPYRSGSPQVGEKIRRIEKVEPLAEERVRIPPIDYERDTGKVGYTVAQYGEPGHVEKHRDPSPEELDYSRTKVTRRVEVQPHEEHHFEANRSESPMYSSVYERYAQEPEEEHHQMGFATSTPFATRQRPQTPPKDFDESIIHQEKESDNPQPFYTSYEVEERTFRGTSPTGYGRTHEQSSGTYGPRGHIYEERTTDRMISPTRPHYDGYPTPDYTTESTTTRVASYSMSPKLDRDLHKRESEEERPFSKTTDEKRAPDLGFMRTQSEIIKDATAPSGLRRSEEKESIYEEKPIHQPRLSRTSETEEWVEQAKREAEVQRIKREDERILGRHGLLPDEQEDAHQHRAIDVPIGDLRRTDERSNDSMMHPRFRDAHTQETSIDYPPEPMTEMGDVIEVAATHRPMAPHEKQQELEVEVLMPEEEMPHSPPPSAPTTPKITPKSSIGKKAKKDKDGKVFDFGKSKFTSKHEVIKRGKDVDVKLDGLKLGKDDTLRVVVMPPVRHLPPGEEPIEIETKVKKSGSKYEITFKPNDVGTHKVFAYVNEIQHPLSPFPIRVYDASEILVGDIPTHSKLNDTVEFTVDAGRAGFGNLEMAIKDADGVIIPSHVAQLETGSAKFLVTFAPATKGTHTVNITFNKEVLKNSPFQVHITDEGVPPEPSSGAVGVVPIATPELSKKELKKLEEERKKEEKERIKREKEEKVATLKREKDAKKGKKGASTPLGKTTVTKIPSLSRVGQPSHLLITIAGGDELEINVYRTAPDGTKITVPTEVTETDPGVMQIAFIPEAVGDHEIEVKTAGQHVSGSPFTCRAYDPAKIKVGNIPSGAIDKPVHFVVDASEAGVGNLEVAVNEGRIPSMANSLGQHRYDISFVPREVHDHTITVRFNNEPVPGSPFICKISAATPIAVNGPGLERVSVGEPTEFEVSSHGDERPDVVVRDPQGVIIDSKLHPIQGGYSVRYVPQIVGNHTVEVAYNKEQIAGSPFTVKAYDAEMVRLSSTSDLGARVGKPTTFSIDAAKAGAGNMEIIVSVDGRNVPNFVQSEGQARFKVSFTPQEAREHIVSVRFNGHPIPGSPMRCQVTSVDGPPVEALHIAPHLQTEPLAQSAPPQGKMKLLEESSVAHVGQRKGFNIETTGRSGDCNVIVTAPDQSRLPVHLQKTKSGFHFDFTPQIPGEHRVEASIDGYPVGDDFFVKVTTDPLSIARLPSTCVVGKKYSFEIPTYGRNRHDVRVNIRSPEGKPLPVQLEDLPNGNVKATCRFKQHGPHIIDTFVQDEAVGEKQTVEVIDGNRGVQLISEIGREVVGEPAEVRLLMEKGLESQVEVKVSAPDGRPLTVHLSKISQTTMVAEWTPQVDGEHEVEILVGGEQIDQSPYLVQVLDPASVRVIGIKNDRVGVEQRFNVDYTNSGASTAQVEVSLGNRTIPCQLKKVRDGLLVGSFVPKQPGMYLLDVTIDGLNLQPIECHISSEGAVRATGDALRFAQKGRTARFEVSTNNATRGELDVLVSDPQNGPLPVRCYRQQDDSYWVEFTPEQTGEHSIEVTFGDVPVPGSPFKCQVVDPKKVQVRGLQDGLTLRHAATIALNRREAGTKDLMVEVSDPEGKPLKVDMMKSPNGEDRATFLPTQLGPHKINVKAAGFPLPGFPQTIHVAEMSQPAIYGAAVDQSVKVGEPASFIFDPKKSTGGLKIDVRGPQKTKVRHNTMRRPNGTSEVVFYPDEVGLYVVNVHFNNKNVQGSPVEVKVIDPQKVLVDDRMADRDGHLQLGLNQRSVIDIDATAAGPGKLRAEVRDANDALVTAGGTGGTGPVVVEELGYGKWRVAVEPRHPGRHALYLYWNELPVETAFPLRMNVGQGGVVPGPSTSKTYDYVAAAAPLHKKERSTGSTQPQAYDDEAADHLHVILRGDGLRRAQLKEPAEFIVDGSDISRDGRLTATLIGQKADIPVKVQQLGHNVYKALYTPMFGGNYELHVLWNGRHVRGSPFAVVVATSSGVADSIVVDTSTLKIGIVNEEVKTLIDTRRSGPGGKLSAQCMGPSKLAYCELYDHRDGTYTLSIRPTEVGKHTLTIKYDGEHVAGSPFLVHVSMPPDPSKVRVYGPGIEHGILSLFKSNFVVETKGAGAGQLTVRVRGPKGAFNVEMQREKKNERTIHCKYEPREPGDYQVEVKWHGEHVPGSPFLVMIVDTEQELARFLRGEAPSPVPVTPFIPPGWMGPPPGPMGFPGHPGHPGRGPPPLMGPPRSPFPPMVHPGHPGIPHPA